MKFLTFLILIHFLIIYNGESRADWWRTSGPSGGTVYSLAISGINLFAGTDSGAYISTNDGDNWTKLNIGPVSVKVNALIVSGINLFAGSDSGMFLSTNSGINWTQAGLNNIVITSLAISGSNIFAGTYYHGVYTSTDNGTNWTQVNNGLTNTYVFSLAVNGTNIFAAAGLLFLSTNNGTSWTKLGLNDDVHSLAVSGSNIFAGTIRNGVYLSKDNGINWAIVNNGMTNYNVHVVTANGTNIYTGTDGSGVFVSTNDGTNWKIASTGLFPDNAIYSFAFSSSNIFTGTDGSDVWRRPLSEFTGVRQEANGSPNEFKLFQNFPNPFNPSTIISYKLKERGYVKLKLFDIKGDLIRILVDEIKNAGYYESEFRSTGLASGIYFYRIEIIGIDNFINYADMKKAILLK